ncbi:unnamed protein product [Cuscuta campestris]|uniref:Wax synthase domain-containing protein n=1 Tax=Cuscuta campestris TaxID=132261 RepID=A0A484NQI8_9ASTE|nr:unnamed protein product [Cuscuta campestris]
MEKISLTHVWFLVLASLVYCYFVSANLPKGIFRFISLTPVFGLFTVFPLLHSSAFCTAVAFFFFTWLSNFKLLAFSFDRGPLSSSSPAYRSLLTFIAMASLPLRLKKKNVNRSKILRLNLAAEIAGFAGLLQLIFRYGDGAHQNLVLIWYSLLVFLMVDVLVGVSGFAVRVLTGLDLDPPSDEPYLSCSLREFWGRRWNLTVTNTFRFSVYDPVRELSAAVIGGAWAPLPAMMATFALSGLMHELLVFYVARARPSWEMTAFFLLHGVCVAAEYATEQAWGGTPRLPRAVSGPLTVGFVVGTTFWLFFPPLIRSGADKMVLEELKTYIQFIHNHWRSLVIAN